MGSEVAAKRIQYLEDTLQRITEVIAEIDKMEDDEELGRWARKQMRDAIFLLATNALEGV